MRRSFRIFTISFGFFIVYLFIHLFLVLFDQRDFAKLENSKLKSKYESSSEKINAIPPGGTLDNIFWFVQVTDIHLSKFSDHGRTPDLYDFCRYTIPILHPDFVLASGDLTDAKSLSQQDSSQYIEEWQAYKRVLEESGVLKVTPWFDIRGNHDTFNVPYLQHKDNFFREFSVQGRHHLQSYYFQHKKPFGTYAFIGMDANPNPGPKRPYNFHGVISTSNAQILQNFSLRSSGANMTVWFGHHPTSTIVSLNVDLRRLIGQQGVAYLCGHLHTWHGIVPRMHVLQPQGFLELELGDWRDCRIYRVAAIDHDIFSFVDVRHNQWPVVLVTNPKDARYLLPSKEMVHKIGLSTHIRMLVWSPAAVQEVLVHIDGQLVGTAQRVKPESPLFVLPWQPRRYPGPNSHTLSVTARDVEGRVRQVSHEFSTDGAPVWDFDYMAALLLLTYQPHNVRLLYYCVWATLLGVVLVMRLVKFRLHWLRGYLDHSVIVSLYRFANHDPLFYSLVIYLLYTAVGPLMIGYVIDGHVAMVFLYGIKVSNTFIPEYFPYVSEFLQNVTFVFPLCLYLLRRIHQNDMTTPPLASHHHRRWASWLLHFCWRRFGYVSLVTWQTFYWFTSVYMAYGGMAALLSPCRLWLLPMSYFMLRSVPSCPKLDAASVMLSAKRHHSNSISQTNESEVGVGTSNGMGVLSKEEMPQTPSTPVTSPCLLQDSEDKMALHPDPSFADLLSMQSEEDVSATRERENYRRDIVGDGTTTRHNKVQ